MSITMEDDYEKRLIEIEEILGKMELLELKKEEEEKVEKPEEVEKKISMWRS